uniref:CS domain-containing protein n=1 Tax=Amorphochlora amoebiformis TaxID=1561963 RepID=A0A7S0DRL4_9EUKA
MATVTPTFKWAQSRSKVFVTIQLTNIDDLKHSISDKSFAFTGVRGPKKYELNFEMPHAVDPKASKFVPGRHPRFDIAKADSKIFWTRLCSDKRRFKNFCKVDFDKWKDEDELYDEEEEDDSKEEEKKTGEVSAMGVPPSLGGMTQEGIEKLMSEVKLKKGKIDEDPDSDDDPLSDLEA